MGASVSCSMLSPHQLAHPGANPVTSPARDHGPHAAAVSPYQSIQGASCESRSSKLATTPLSRPVNGSFPAVSGYDPLSYLEGACLAGDEGITSSYKGAVYRFTSQQHKITFQMDPSKHVPQFGGFCATGIAHGHLTDVDPTNFKVADGKLYLFSRTSEMNTIDIWNADEKNTEQAACANWANGNF